VMENSATFTKILLLKAVFWVQNAPVSVFGWLRAVMLPPDLLVDWGRGYPVSIPILRQGIPC